MARADLKQAVDLALAGKWDAAHVIVQADEADPVSCWLHACLHKIEGDESNARYWYARCDRQFEDFADAQAELAAIRAAVS